ncbi:MAG: hypothetical protein J5I93_19220 [Pirellulaceae bacterium]|nr:hypothetical protein [Pirellulaceae bacterium]
MVRVRTNGPRIVDISPQNRLIAEGRIKLTTYFNRENPLNSALAKDKAFYVIKGPGTNAASGDGPQDVIYDATDNAVTLVFQDYQYDGNFVVSITPRPASGKSLNDLFGNTLELDDPGATSYDIPLVRTRLSETPSVAPGISHTTGPYVPFHEFTGPRESTSGFNPNDKVETRVARLYYYRDAHRVAQIINRKVKSYNRQAVDMARQLADRARQEAERRTRARQAAEREAIRKAEETRAAERDLQAAEQQFAEAARSLNRQVRQGTTDPEQQRDVASLEELVRRTGGQVDRLRSTVQQLRGQEAQANEQAQVQEALEQAAVADQFRQEVAAAAADPDTFAPGVPDSYDPVEQVSVSVIGEGLIHLRGPLKGINIIRTMIDQIDTPMGQVRVSVHTVQINGEREQRMEVVANRIQRYIDQARFLTLQCGEMLRRAVVQVAARKAEEARALYPESTQHARDQRYLYAFFGEDFVEELRSLDSEFLRTGNKLLSLHSMDTTSLSSALTLMALAKNSTRQEIFAEFDQMMATELPAAEARNLEAGMAGCEGDEKSGCKEPPPFYPLAQNARFESLRAFFNGEIGHDDTMTPLQREFIRLAQILKSRLITELEYKQRVTERAIIEELLGNRLDELRAAKTKEEKAGELYDRRQEAIQEAQVKVVNQVAVVTAEAGVVDERLRRYGATAEEVQGTLRAVWMKLEQHSRRRVDRTIQRWATEFQKVDPKLSNALKTETDAIMARYAASNDQSFGERTHQMDQEIVEALNRALLAAGEDKYPIKRDLNIEVDVQIPSVLGHPSFIYRFEIDPDGRVIVKDGAAFMRPLVATLSATASEASTWINDNFNLSAPESEHLKEVVELLQRVSPEEDVKAIDNLSQLLRALERISSILVVVRSNVTQLTDDLRRIARGIDEEQISGEQVLADWYRVRDSLLRFTRGPLRTQKVEAAVQATQKAFDELLDQAVRLNLARKNAANSRRPLDHKKFLDQLIDDLEEKYIELLEGTRAHTANIDNYLKRLTTALDDDFNTQFYFPTFRFVREASTYWDVQFGQTETTSILANNRQFAKVLPGATMEFDLPARDILLVEAVNGAKALIDDVGALANDPTFLAAARLQGPFSTASPPRGTTNGLPPERNVLSGLSTDTAERLLAQNSGSQNQFGANLENLIPDPAIYKFETGTGYEIRPVIQPDGQAVVFDFNYLYTTNVREPVRADEKHLGRVKRHFIHTDVQLSNFELREVSRYQVALKAARTSRGVPLFEDVPVVGVLFRPLPSQESSLQQNLVMAQATIFPTLFDLMGLRWAPVVADVDPMQLSNREFIVRGRQSFIQNRVYDEASSQVDHFLRIPESLRRPDLYRSQYTIPRLHPNGYNGAGLDYRDSTLQEGYQPNRLYPQERFAPPKSQEGAPFLPHRNYGHPSGTYVEEFPVQDVMPRQPDPRPLSDPGGRNVPSVAPGAAAPGRWTPASGGGQPGQPEPNALPTPPSINAPLPAGGGPQFPHHQAPPFSVLVPAQGQVVTPSQPQQLRQTPAAQMSSRASHFQPGSQDR